MSQKIRQSIVRKISRFFYCLSVCVLCQVQVSMAVGLPLLARHTSLGRNKKFIYISSRVNQSSTKRRIFATVQHYKLTSELIFQLNLND